MHAAELRNDQKFIPTALIIASSGILSHTFLFDQLAHCFSTSTQDVFFTFTPSEAPNLKTALRNIAAKITSPINNERFPRLHDGGRDVSRQNSKLLEYDLTAVQRWLVGREIGNVVMALQDSEGFDSNVLAEVVETLQYGCFHEFFLHRSRTTAFGSTGYHSRLYSAWPLRPICLRSDYLLMLSNTSMASASTFAMPLNCLTRFSGRLSSHRTSV